MTIEEKLKKMLFNCGMFEDQASQVIAKFIAESDESMNGRWSEPADAYPDALFAALWINLKDTTLAWIDENIPQAWFRSTFAQ